ncbi:MAG: GatB/YqeY domain-containing protein [Flavobacteriaceae bacterium]|tara:strand:- start:1310 stop:1759 length:450 start_codon:yes stop_codon:yes gene_type:complete
MPLQDAVMNKIKDAMRAKDTVALTSLRAIKSAILLAQTSGLDTLMSEEEEIKLVQKLVKQRHDSAAIYREQGREDLAAPELEEAAVIAQFLPEQLSEEAVKGVVANIIASTGAAGMGDMGRVMGLASKELAGKADGKTISAAVKALLTA